jgi:hypothetical protein
MGWARLDDGWHDHPKVIEVGLEGAGLFAMCLTWAHRARRTSPTPGVVPAQVLTRFAGPKAARLSKRLREAGLFDERVPAGWPIHDFAEYLPKYDADQAKAAGQASGKARAAQKHRAAEREEPLPEPPDEPNEPLDEPVSEPFSEPLEETGTVDERTGNGSHARVDAGASARRNPEPVPGPGRGDVERGGHLGDAGASGPPPPRCPRHLEQPAAGACGPCGDARRAREQFDRAAEQRRRDSGPVVGGHECPQHPGERAGLCGRCAATAVPMPDSVRELRRRRPPQAS